MSKATIPTVEWEKRFRWIVIGIAVAIVISQWVRIMRRPEGDFILHWDWAKRFVANEFLYAGGMNKPYSPFWAMAYSPLTLLPVHAAQMVAYPLGVVFMGGLLVVLRSLTRGTFTLDAKQNFWATVIAVTLALRFLTRDLIDCGQNTAIVLLAWLGIWCWTRRRDLPGGVLLGFATALKWTPGLFIAYFAWKRQWKIVIIGLLSTALFTVAPALRQGPHFYMEHMRTWISGTWTGITESDPSRGVLGEDHFKNISLRPAMARFLMRLPQGHAGRVEHPLYFDFFDFPPRVAGLVIKATLAALLLCFAWLFRGKITSRNEVCVIWECACLSLLILLFSPITWRNHCVAVLPACYLLSHLALERRGLPRWINLLMAFYILAVPLLNRDLLGSKTSFLLDSYHILTWAIIALLAATAGGLSLARVQREKLVISKRSG
ncbi:MAG: glycosyltransferase family 87 protein [Verrucomicrobiota bacterium]